MNKPKFDHLFIQPNDFNRTFKFFTQHCKWKVESMDGSEAEADRLAFLVYADFKLVLAEDHEHTDSAQKPEVYKTKGRISIHFSTDDVDETFKQIESGPHVKIKPENTHWGTRWFMLEDPDGNQFAWQGPPK